MRSNKLIRHLLVALLFVGVIAIQCQISGAYKTEVEITPSPIDEPTTKKSGFFSGIRNFFRSETTTTTTAAPPFKTPSSQLPGNLPAISGPQRPAPVNTPGAPLMPLGPKPDAPPSTPVKSGSQFPPVPTSTARAPQPPQLASNGGGVFGPSVMGQRTSNGPAYPPGFGTYSPPRALPSGLDLSYGGAGGGGAHNAIRPGPGLSPLTSSSTTTTTTTTTTRRPQQVKEDFPALPPPRRGSVGSKDDVVIPGQHTPTPSARPSSPSTWNTPTATPHTSPSIIRPGSLPYTPTTPHSSPVPQSPSQSTTTVRPGFTSSTNSYATDDEIRTLSEALFTKEVNNQRVGVNPQGKTRSIDSGDQAPEPLLTVDPKVLESPTIAKMRLLFNNYESDTLTNEHVTANERKEENDFLDAIMPTTVMRHAMQFLQNKGLVTADPKTHKDLLRELWFTQYSRGKGRIGSSGFEHVFVHEVKEGTLIGLHNWVYFADEEKNGNLDYKGYLKQLDLGTKAKLMKVRFSHRGTNKPVNSLFIGTSPELEMALYTVCFMVRRDRSCPVSLSNNEFSVVTYSWRYRGKNLIGSAYAEL